MLLSIVMMIKNEERYLEKTLSALKPLMDEINSELIIMDTGSSDNSINIAKKYTNYVYVEEWNNNFADMRNKSIEYANGKWILILDADEELVEYKNIIKFFNSNLYKKYNTATIELKNIMSEDEKKFGIICLPRLFKNYKGFKYTGAIHEQPLWKEPVYNRIATFKHYGYLFIDEELRQRKDNRNKEILLKEIEKNPDDPYLNYQVGKQYICSKEYEDALIFLKKSCKLYNKLNTMPAYLILDLIGLYIHLNRWERAKELCIKYIEKDKNNIDIYYYLGVIEEKLCNYEKSIEYFIRYKYLIENYEVSTQANDMKCPSTCLQNIVESEIIIINNYYKLEEYNKIIESLDKISEETIKGIYFTVFMSLKKAHKIEVILEIYNKYCKTESEKNKFYVNLELMIMNSSKNDKVIIFDVLSQVEGNYGILNQVRSGKSITIEECNNIILQEQEVFYGDLIYYVLKRKESIVEAFKDVSYINIKNILKWLVANKKECSLDLYNIVTSELLSLDLNAVKLNSIISNVLLFNGNLIKEKYENVFLIYLQFQYEYIRCIYNKELSDEELMELVKDTESKFILKFVNIQKIKEKSHLEYIRRMKKLLIENKQYRKAISIFIKSFEKEISESKELKILKDQYKNLIKEEISKNNLDNAEKMIKEYKTIFEYEKIYNEKAILSLYKNNLNSAKENFKLAYCIDNCNEDILFNIAYIKEMTGEYKDAIGFYNKIIVNSSNNEEILELNEKIKMLLKYR